MLDTKTTSTKSGGRARPPAAVKPIAQTRIATRPGELIEIDLELTGTPVGVPARDSRGVVFSLHWFRPDDTPVDETPKGYGVSPTFGSFRYISTGGESERFSFSEVQKVPKGVSIVEVRVYAFSNPTVAVRSIALARASALPQVK